MKPLRVVIPENLREPIKNMLAQNSTDMAVKSMRAELLSLMDQNSEEMPFHLAEKLREDLSSLERYNMLSHPVRQSLAGLIEELEKNIGEYEN